MPHVRTGLQTTSHAAIVLGLMTILLGVTPGLSAFEDRAALPQNRHRVTGLFSPDRQDDLREAVEQLPGIKLVGVDFKYGEASFEYDAEKLFPKAKPEQVVERLNDLLRSVSMGTFGIRPLSSTPRDKLLPVEILVVGLDCKGCSFAAYEAVSTIDGVEQATASFKAGRVTALIDPARTDRAALESALKKKGVQLKDP